MQSERDRGRGAHDYEVNFKAELKIMMLHERLDQLQQKQWLEMMALQRELSESLCQLASQGLSGRA